MSAVCRLPSLLPSHSLRPQLRRKALRRDRVMNVGASGIVAAVVSLVLMESGCASSAEGDGGAIELSWVLRNQRGTLIDCAAADVTKITLHWSVGDVAASATWPCDDRHGLTRFVVPPGDVSLFVTAGCADAPADPATYYAPATLVRTVTEGQVVALGAVVFVLQNESCELQACTCQ